MYDLFLKISDYKDAQYCTVSVRIEHSMKTEKKSFKLWIT